MTAQQNETAARRFLEDIWSRNERAAIDELLTDDFVFRLPFLELEGIEKFQALVNANRTAFQDLTYRVEDIVAGVDKAAACWTMSGKHVGEWGQVPATQRDVSIEGITFYTFADDGRIKEAYVQNDVRGLMRQLIEEK